VTLVALIVGLIWVMSAVASPALFVIPFIIAKEPSYSGVLLAVFLLPVWVTLAIYLIGPLWLAIPVAVLEGRGLSCFSRGFALSRGYRWRLFGVVAVIVILNVVAQFLPWAADIDHGTSVAISWAATALFAALGANIITATYRRLLRYTEFGQQDGNEGRRRFELRRTYTVRGDPAAMNIVVVGAGVVGVAAAYYLARAGHDVMVLERRAAPGLEASYANGGQLLGETVHPWLAPEVPGQVLRNFSHADAPYRVRFSLAPERWLWGARFLSNCSTPRVARITDDLRRLAVHSLAALTELREDEPFYFDHSRLGVLRLYRSAASFAKAAEAARGEDPVRRPNVLSWAECLELEPALAASRVRFVGGLHYHQEETGDARKFTAALAAAAERLGATFHYGATVQRLIRNGGKVTGVETESGLEAAGAVVLSAGCHSGQLLRPLGLRVPIYPVKGYAQTLPANGDGAPKVALQDVEHKTGITPFGSRIRIAGTAELDGFNKRADPKRAAAMLADLMAILPECGDPAHAELWTGLRPMTPDCAPILGRSPIKNLYLDTGHGSLGWTLACGSGQVIADIVSGRPPAVDLSGLTIERFL
jgi:D-amino-acid dehydrogenase